MNNLETQENKVLKFLGFMWNPLSWVMEIAAIMAIVLANGGVINNSICDDECMLLCTFLSDYLQSS